mgnify:CR=1 FL=1
MYPAKHHYTPLDIVNNQPCIEFTGLKTIKGEGLRLEDHITVVLFLGKSPMNYVTASSNLKELVYDKFKGFKKFQIVAIASEEAGAQIETLKIELTQYESLKYWHFLINLVLQNDRCRMPQHHQVYFGVVGDALA